MFINAEWTTLSGAVQEVSTFFTAAWSMITSNWVLASICLIPIVLGLVGGLIALVRR